MPWRAISFLILFIGVLGANSLLLSPISPLVALDLARSPAQVMIASSAYGIGVMIAALTLAPLVDRIGTARALRRAGLGMVAGFSISALAPSLPWLIAAQALVGLCAGAALPAIYARAAEIAPPGQSARILGAVLTGWTLSMVVGVLAAAILAQWAGWRVVFAVLAMASLALTFGTGRTTAPPPHSAPPNWRETLRVEGLGPAMLSTAAFMLAFYVPYALLGAHVAVIGGSATMAGIAAMSYGVGFGVSVVLDRWIERLRRKALAIGFTCLAAIYAGLALFSGSLPVLIAVAAVWGLVNHATMNALMTRLTALSAARRGAVLGLYSATTYACVFAAPLIGALLWPMGFAALAWFSVAAVTIGALEGVRWRAQSSSSNISS